MGHHVQITFDAADPPELARFWQLALDYVEEPPPPGFKSWNAFADANNIPIEQRFNYGSAVDPEGHGPRLLFLKVPEGKMAKNRVHLDVHAADADAHVERLVAAGATRVEKRSELGSTWTVMLDPEGNEFCVAEARV